jgi:hypothetical protein
MPPPPDPKLVAAEAYELKDREIAAEVDAIASAISVRREGGLLIAEAEQGEFVATPPWIFATGRCPALYGHAPCRGWGVFNGGHEMSDLSLARASVQNRISFLH